MKRYLFTALLLVNLSAASAQNAPLEITEQSIKDDLSRVVCKDKERAESVKQLFIAKGAKAEEVVIGGSKNVQNLVLTKKGKTSEIIVIGAHYDKVSDGCGAIDNWTGIVLLANLYSVFSKVDTNKTLIFAAFGREEEGLIGSREMVKSIAKENRTQYCSMVNLDSFGLHYPQVLSNASNLKMTAFAKDLAAEVKMPFSQASLSGTADADSSSFVDGGIPAITFHGLSNRWADILHTYADKPEKINTKLVFIAYQFAGLYIDRIEAMPCAAFRK